MVAAHPPSGGRDAESTEGLDKSGALASGSRGGAGNATGRRKHGRGASRGTRLVRRRSQRSLMGGCVPVYERQRMYQRLRSGKRGRKRGGHVRERPGPARVGRARSVQQRSNDTTGRPDSRGMRGDLFAERGGGEKPRVPRYGARN